MLLRADSKERGTSLYVGHQGAQTEISFLHLSKNVHSERVYEFTANRSNVLRLIHTYHVVPMPFPCHAVPLPCLSLKSLDCVFPIWFTQCGRILFTDAMPFPCHATNMLFWKRPLKATAQRGMVTAWEQHGMSELTSAVLRRHVGDLPAFGEW
jgi:hypothetical protein